MDERSKPFLIAIAAMVVIGLIAFAFLTGMPFGGPHEKKPIVAVTPESTETVGEAPAPAGSAPLVVDESPGVPATAPPLVEPAPVPRYPLAPSDVIPPSASGQNVIPSGDIRPRRVPPSPVTAAPAPDARTPRQINDLSESDAMALLAGRIHELYPDISTSCIELRSSGAVDGGYSFDAMDACGGKTLDRWRVDTATRELTRKR